MPSPVRDRQYGGFYRRKDGAYIKVGNIYKKVGANKYKNRVHYSKRNVRKDRKRRATKSPRLRRKYPQAYD